MNRAEDLHDMGITLINRLWRPGLAASYRRMPLLDGHTWGILLHNALKEENGEYQRAVTETLRGGG